MKKAVFTAMAALSLPVLLNSCSLFEQSSDKTLPQKSQTPAEKPAKPAVPAVPAKTETPKKETVVVATPEVKKEAKETEAPKKETVVVAAPEVKEVKKAEVPKTQETVSVPAPEKVQLPCKYVVKTNDSLWRLAVEYYGKGAKWTLILEANKNKIKNPDHLEPGTELTIPALPKNQ